MFLLTLVYFSDVSWLCVYSDLKSDVLIDLRLGFDVSFDSCMLFWCFLTLKTILMFLILSYWLFWCFCSIYWLCVYSDVSFDLKSDVLIGLGLGFWCFLTLKTIVMFLIYPIDYSDVSVLSYWLWSLFWLDFLVYSDVSFDFCILFWWSK